MKQPAGLSLLPAVTGWSSFAINRLRQLDGDVRFGHVDGGGLAGGDMGDVAGLVGDFDLEEKLAADIA